MLKQAFGSAKFDHELISQLVKHIRCNQASGICRQAWSQPSRALCGAHTCLAWAGVKWQRLMNFVFKVLEGDAGRKTTGDKGQQLKTSCRIQPRRLPHSALIALIRVLSHSAAKAATTYNIQKNIRGKLYTSNLRQN